jgi:hypothetical protein
MKVLVRVAGYYGTRLGRLHWSRRGAQLELPEERAQQLMAVGLVRVVDERPTTHRRRNERERR